MEPYIKKVSDVPIYSNTQPVTNDVTAEYAIQRLSKALKLWKREKKRQSYRRNKNDNQCN